MKLIDYLNAIPVEARAAFASRCGTSFDYLRQVGYGNRTCTEKLAINLERESNRKLVCEELCPEADWAFIRSTTVPTQTCRVRRKDDPPEDRSNLEGRQLAEAHNSTSIGH